MPKIMLIQFLIALLLLSGCSRPEKSRDTVVISGRTMGTDYMVKIVSSPQLSGKNVRQIRQGIDSLLSDVNQRMSTFDSESEISRFNLSPATDWFAVSLETAEVFRQSLEISALTGGAFDITVAPLVNLWGFGPAGSVDDPPNDAAIEQALLTTGYHQISARLSPSAVKKSVPEVHCDLAAIAKGRGVDDIASYLDSRGLADYLIEIGGEIKAKGKNQQDMVWQVGVATPDSESGIRMVVSLSGSAMATSGDYRNYFELDGSRYSHIIDPRTGSPITHNLASVTVIHSSCAYADAMATAISVLGPEAGYRFAREEKLPVLLIVREGDNFVEKMTLSFADCVTPVDGESER